MISAAVLLAGGAALGAGSVHKALQGRVYDGRAWLVMVGVALVAYVWGVLEWSAGPKTGVPLLDGVQGLANTVLFAVLSCGGMYAGWRAADW